MAWRPSDCLIEGELDNTNPDKITGWMRFTGMKRRVIFNLVGNFHRDIRGAKIKLHGEANPKHAATDEPSGEYMQGFSYSQRGEAGDITAGRPPVDYVDYPYIEWYSKQNGRVVIELDPTQIEIVGKPIPAIESDPISRKEQNAKMTTFLDSLADSLVDGLKKGLTFPAQCVIVTIERQGDV